MTTDIVRKQQVELDKDISDLTAFPSLLISFDRNT